MNTPLRAVHDFESPHLWWGMLTVVRFKTALLSSAAGIILVHNHPTGDPSPSSEDVAITRRLKEVGDIIGINVTDHVIVGSEGMVSFVERALL